MPISRSQSSNSFISFCRVGAACETDQNERTVLVGYVNSTDPTKTMGSVIFLGLALRLTWSAGLRYR